MAPACFNSVDRADAVVDEVVMVALLSSYSTDMYAYAKLITHTQSEIHGTLHLSNLSQP